MGIYSRDCQYISGKYRMLISAIASAGDVSTSANAMLSKVMFTAHPDVRWYTVDVNRV